MYYEVVISDQGEVWMEKHKCSTIQVDYQTGEQYVITTFLNMEIIITLCIP